MSKFLEMLVYGALVVMVYGPLVVIWFVIIVMELGLEW